MFPIKFQGYFGSLYLLPFLIILGVIAFNFPFVFFDGLWHDDGYWYYLATEGDVINESRSKVSAFVPYMDYFYAMGMVSAGTKVMHFIYILIMAITSVCFYYFYHSTLSIKKIIAIPASILPGILPSLMIPIGFNASYAIWVLPPLLLSLILLYRANYSPYSYLYWLAFLCFYVMLNVSGAGTFLIPIVLLFFFYQSKQKPILSIVTRMAPFVLYGFYHLYTHGKHSHREPTFVGIDVIAERALGFLDMSNIMGFLDMSNIISIGRVTALVYMLLGVVAVMRAGIGGFNVFNCKVITRDKVFIVLFVLCWLVANSVAYLALTAEFRLYDYAYVFNFGSILLQIIGVVYMLHLLLLLTPLSKVADNLAILIMIMLIFFTGGQRIHAYENSGWIRTIEKSSHNIREALATVDLPMDSQIILLDINTTLGSYVEKNTGFVRYITGRNDVMAIIGNDRYPLDPFDKAKGWFDVMKGMDIGSPVISFRFNKGRYERVSYLLVSSLNEVNKYPRIKWHLFDISDEKIRPVLVKEGEGIDAYIEFLDSYFGEDVPYIAFSPEDSPARIINEESANSIGNKGNLLSHSVNYLDVATLTNLQEVKLGGNKYLQALVKVGNNQDNLTKIGYKLSWAKDIHSISVFEYTQMGDYVLFYCPIPEKKSISNVDLELYNVGVWPRKIISVVDY